jgi:uncharacterized membrane protein
MIFEFIRIVLGSVFFLFVPGFAVSLAIFPRKEIDVVERITLSLAFSVTVTPLVILLLNLWLGVALFPIDLLHSLVASLSIIAVSWMVWFLRTRLP